MIVLQIIGVCLLAWVLLPAGACLIAARNNPARLDPDDCYCTVVFDQGYPVVVETCAYHNARIVAEAERIAADASR